jgi:hypothetical protein
MFFDQISSIAVRKVVTDCADAYTDAEVAGGGRQLSQGG